MLIQTDRLELTDARLSPEEAVAKEREELLRIAGKKKIWGQKELEDQERSAGPRIPYTEFLRRVRSINSDILVVDGSVGSVAIYIPKTRKEIEEDEPSAHRYDQHKYVGGIEKHELPEFSHVILDTSELPVREYRGWRTPLMSMILGGALSYNEAVKAFGEPTGTRAGRWFEALREHKFYSNNRFVKETR